VVVLASYLKTIGAVRGVAVVDRRVLIDLHRIADVTLLMRICILMGYGESIIPLWDKPLAKILSEEARESGITFSGLIGQIREGRKITFLMPPGEQASYLELYEENSREKGRRFYFN
jgi:hypothetical protein